MQTLPLTLSPRLGLQSRLRTTSSEIKEDEENGEMREEPPLLSSRIEVLVLFEFDLLEVLSETFKTKQTLGHVNKRNNLFVRLAACTGCEGLHKGLMPQFTASAFP